LPAAALVTSQRRQGAACTRQPPGTPRLRMPRPAPHRAPGVFPFRIFLPIMNALLALSRAIDALNLRVGRAVTWVTLLVVLVSAGNAVVRKVFEMSSNAWLELQWYMFGAMFLLTAGYTLLKNEHVRVD